MRARNIKPSFFSSEDLAGLSAITRLLFIGLWCMADRDGRLKDQPRKIKAEILPHDKNAPVDFLLSALASRNLIIRYSVDGVGYIAIRNFIKHQKPCRAERPSELPAPPNQESQGRVEVESGGSQGRVRGESGESQGRVRGESGESQGRVQKKSESQQGLMASENALITDVLITDPLITDARTSAPNRVGGFGPDQFFSPCHAPQDQHAAAQRVVKAYQEKVKTAHAPSGAKIQVLEVIGTGLATEADLLSAIDRFAAHATKTYADPTKRMSARRFFSKEAPAWPDWVEGSPVPAEQPRDEEADLRAAVERARARNREQFRMLGIEG
jgi:hypothetical protein